MRENSTHVVDRFELGPIGTNCYVVRASQSASEAVVIDPSGPHHYVNDTDFNHYSMLRTIEDAWGLAEPPPPRVV